MRNGRPLILAISTNDGLGANAKNIGLLLNSKHIYFVPFCQDDAFKKINSLIAKMDMLVPAVSAALDGVQLQPVLV